MVQGHRLRMNWPICTAAPIKAALKTQIETPFVSSSIVPVLLLLLLPHQLFTTDESSESKEIPEKKKICFSNQILRLGGTSPSKTHVTSSDYSSIRADTRNSCPLPLINRYQLENMEDRPASVFHSEVLIKDDHGASCRYDVFYWQNKDLALLTDHVYLLTGTALVKEALGLPIQVRLCPTLCEQRLSSTSSFIHFERWN